MLGNKELTKCETGKELLDKAFRECTANPVGVTFAFSSYKSDGYSFFIKIMKTTEKYVRDFKPFEKRYRVSR